jgi:CheY-like chemotaxis protein
MDVLIAEDENVSRTLVRSVLESAGHRVSAVSDGREAWKSWQTLKHRLIVSDWLMPVTDGLELCRRVRARRDEPYTYFILLTGRTGRESSNLQKAVRRV